MGQKASTTAGSEEGHEQQSGGQHKFRKYEGALAESTFLRTYSHPQLLFLPHFHRMPLNYRYLNLIYS